MQLLNGDWKANDKYGSSLEFTKLDYDDSGWETIAVPGHWQEHPAYAHYPEKMLFRKRFACGEPAPGNRFFIRFEGVFYFARVWLNGVYLGEHTGYFEPFEFDATRALREGENALALFVRCEREKLVNEKSQIMGVFSHWDCIPEEIQPGGIWGNVLLDERPAAHLKAVGVSDFQIEPDGAEAIFRVSATIEGAAGGILQGLGLKWTLTPANFDGTAMEGEIVLDPAAAGECEASFEVAVPSPRLWWTWDRGLQNLYKIEVSLADAGGNVLHTLDTRFGIRTIELRDWIFHLNGKRLFCRGSNYAPGDVRIASMDKERYAGDVRLMREANLNMIRVHAHIEREEFYDECDANGILVWQDFPLQWFYAPEIESEAVRQIQSMTRLLGNHPSIALWCCHNEPFKEMEAVEMITGNPVESLKKLLDSGIVPIQKNWNRSVLDFKLKETVEEADPSRPVIPSSGVSTIFNDDTDSHLYFGWYMGTMRGLSTLVKLHRKSIRFTTEYGAQAYPNMELFKKMDNAETVGDIDWHALHVKHRLQKPYMDKFVPPRDGAPVEEYIGMSQWYQARVIRYHNEMLRRYKYDPCGGAVHFLFNDCTPAVTWAVADSERGLKQGYFALRDSFRQLLPTADFPRRWYPRGELISLRLFVINDHESAFSGATLKWSFVDSASREQTAGESNFDIEADMAQRVGRARWDSGAAPAGGYALVLELKNPDSGETITNQYEFELRK